MNVDVSTSIVIHRPPREVAAYAAHPDNAPVWYAKIHSVEWQTPRPLRVGSRIAFVAFFLFKRLDYTYEIAEVVPDERLAMRTAQGPFPMETTYTWEPVESGARMTLRNRGTPAGFSRVVAPFVAAAVRQRKGSREVARHPREHHRRPGPRPLEARTVVSKPQGHLAWDRGGRFRKGPYRVRPRRTGSGSAVARPRICREPRGLARGSGRI